MLTGTQQKLAEVESELGSTRAEYAELQAALSEIRAEVKTLEGVHDVEPFNPTSGRHASLDCQTSLERKPICLYSSGRSARSKTRVNSSAMQISLLDRSRMQPGDGHHRRRGGGCAGHVEGAGRGPAGAGGGGRAVA